MEVAVSHSDSPHAWTGLLLDSIRRPANTTAIRTIVGPNAPILVVRESDLPAHTLRHLMQTGATNVLASSFRDDAILLTPLLKIICSLASFRRVILLHDMDPDTELSINHGGILLLRDCLETRSSLRSLIASESPKPFTDSRPAPKNPAPFTLSKESPDAYRFPITFE